MNSPNDPNFYNILRQFTNSLLGKKFVFLLVGRTGVGKSSTINSLLRSKVAPVNDFRPETMEVKSYTHKLGMTDFEIIDTPGLCDDLEMGTSEEYLNRISTKIQEVRQIDSMFFVSRLDEARLAGDEKRAIQMITKHLGKETWNNSVIILTFAGNIVRDKYYNTLQERTKVIREEIGKYVETSVANNIPSIAVDNTTETTPDGKKWVSTLYTEVIKRTKPEGVLPFIAGTYFSYRIEEFNSVQKKEIQNKLVQALNLAATLGGLGATIGNVLGPVGLAIGGVGGALLGFIAGFFTEENQ